MVNRRLRERENGSAGAGPGSFDPYSGVIFDSGDVQEQAMALYHELYGVEGRNRKLDFGTFLQFLERKADKIRQVTGCGQVQFRVIQEDGALSLKAKPLRTQSG